VLLLLFCVIYSPFSMLKSRHKYEPSTDVEATIERFTHQVVSKGDEKTDWRQINLDKNPVLKFKVCLFCLFCYLSLSIFHSNLFLHFSSSPYASVHSNRTPYRMHNCTSYVLLVMCVNSIRHLSTITIHIINWHAMHHCLQMCTLSHIHNVFILMIKINRIEVCVLLLLL
jgi:hypothetical protein